MNHTLLLFDIDGTLITTSGAGVRAMKTVGAKLFGDTFSFEGVIFGGGLDPALFAEAARLSRHTPTDQDFQSFHQAYLVELEAELARTGAGVVAMPGILALLELLRADYAHANGSPPAMLGLLTGNFSKAVPLKLSAAAIDHNWFTITAFGDEAKTRPGLTELAMHRYHHHTGAPADPTRVVVIGDTPRDVNCAKAHGCVAFAVATGTYSQDELAAAGADVVVADFTDPAPLLDLLPH